MIQEFLQRHVAWRFRLYRLRPPAVLDHGFAEASAGGVG